LRSEVVDWRKDGLSKKRKAEEELSRGGTEKSKATNRGKKFVQKNEKLEVDGAGVSKLFLI
jgi:hypothetical protein